MGQALNPILNSAVGGSRQLRCGFMPACALVVLCLSSFASAAPGELLFKATAPNREPETGFGTVLTSVDGNVLVSELFVRPFANDAAGRAYLFDGATGQLKFTFNNPEPQNNDSYAAAVAGGNGRAFISTTGVYDRVYAYSTTTGELLQTINDPDGRSNYFGSALAYGEGRLLVSSPSFSGAPFVAQSIGRAYLFDASTGQLERTLPNPEPHEFDLFGFGLSLAISGNRAIVGAELDGPDERLDPGRVWVFDRGSGNVLFTLENPHPESRFFDSFGFSVAANQDVIAVGSVKDSTSGVEESGTVYLFDVTTGALKHTLFSPQPETDSDFGRSLALTADGQVLVGAWGTTVNGVFGGGHAYLFDSVTGNLLLDIPNPDPTEVGAFGFSIATTGNNLVVGAPAGTGAVYVFEAIPEPSSLVLATSLLVCALAIHQYRSRRTAN